MAQVSMDLEELKSLENKLEEAQNRIIELNDKQMKVLVQKDVMGLSTSYLDLYKLSSLNLIHGDCYTVTLQELANSKVLKIDRKVINTSSEYINLTEVKKEMLVDLQKQVDEQLKSAQKRATDAEYISSNIRDEKDKEIKKLKHEFTDFKEDKERLNLVEELEHLKSTLKTYKNRGLLQRIFNT